MTDTGAAADARDEMELDDVDAATSGTGGTGGTSGVGGPNWLRRSTGARRLLRGRLPERRPPEIVDLADDDLPPLDPSDDEHDGERDGERDGEHDAGDRPPPRLAPRGIARFFGRYVFTSLTRRILLTNLAALIALVGGFLYLDRFREELIEARVDSLRTQAQIVAAAIGARARVSEEALAIDPEALLQLEGGEIAPDAGAGTGAGAGGEPDALLPDALGNDALGGDALGGGGVDIDTTLIRPVMRRLIRLTYTQARVYDRTGVMLLDSNRLYSRGASLQYEVPPLAEPEPPLWQRIWRRIVLWSNDRNLAIYEDTPGEDLYREVRRALEGVPSTEERVTEQGQLIISVAVPIQRYEQTVGALQLSTKPGRIDRKLDGEREAILKVFGFAALVTLLLSVFLASTIARPLHRLAAAAERVRRRAKDREEIPDFSHRRDEIGDLSVSLRDMTGSLYSRIEAIERFAADVSHELKNPLTSLRSAVETLPLAKRDEQRARLFEVIEHDVQRLDRLISDISDASRLDAEMAREDYEPVDLAHMLRMIHASAEQVMQARMRAGERVPRLVLNIEGEVSEGPDGVIDRRRIMVRGHEGRLGQVVSNIVSNARSFVPADGGWIAIDLRTREPEDDEEERGDAGPRRAVLTIADNGPGIPPDKKAKIFERFYTDRPEGEAFGNNSGLGLSIVRQIVEAHGGTIRADNWTLDDRFESDLPEASAARRGGAIFTVTLPMMER